MKISTLLALTLTLAACGGGGGGSREAAFGLGARSAPDLSFPDAPVQAGDVQFTRAFPNLSFPTQLVVTPAPGDLTHLYVATQTGLVYSFDSQEENVSASSVFLDLSDRTRANGEQGLLGMAFDPNYASNGYVYVNYSASAGLSDSVPADTVIARYTATPVTRAADRNTEVQLLRFTQPFLNHNGGGLAFGNDGMLYIASGDGGSGGDPQNNAQNLGNLLGKILRIKTTPGDIIPADNPFVGQSGAQGAIWAYGLRNPFRFSFDPANGRLWAGDVGQSTREEIDLIVKGGNYGWRKFEGTLVFNASDPTPANAIPPILDYGRDQGSTVTGGVVYRGSDLPGLIGRYVYGDFGSGRIWALTESGGLATGNVELGTVGNPTSFGVDHSGEPLITGYGGALFRIVPATGGGPQPFPQKLSDTGLFTDLAALTPSPGVVPYAPNAAFWSDGATKLRWIAVPGGQHIQFSATGNWTFPQGTVTVKHFEIRLADQTLKRLETRVFVNQSSGWQGYTYRWREDGSDADLLSAGESVALDTTHGTQTYEFPSRTQCLQCHTSAAGFVLGLRTAQLNGLYAYPNGVTDNQLRALNQAGYFTSDIGTASNYAALPDPFGAASLAARARAYLETNCSQCHQPGGPTPVNMDLRAGTAIDATNTVNVSGSGASVGGATVRLVPGDKAASLVWTRMNASNEAERMPPIATHLIDASGVELIGAWIDAGAP